MSDPNAIHLYPAGLNLAGRRVVVLGGGRVVQRRLPALLAAGAVVEVVSPEVTTTVEGYARAGDIMWSRRGYRYGDLAGAWYVLVATSDPSANSAASAEAEERRIFCVRSDDAEAATAWTPAVGRHGPVTVAVLGGRDPKRSSSLRDSIMGRLRDGDLIARKDRVRQPGVVLIGAGPGDPELITVAGRRALHDADVVIADRLAPQALLAELGPEVELFDAAKLPRGRSADQEALNALMVAKAREGKCVVRLKGGDPFVFGRGYEELQACASAGVPCRVVPGLTSAVSVPAVAGIPVTHRGQTHEFTVVSGHLPPGHPDSLVDWQALARMRGTIVVLMGVENLTAITAALLRGGRSGDTAACAIQEGSLQGEREVVGTLDTIADRVRQHDIQAPAVIVIGTVVATARGTQREHEVARELATAQREGASGTRH